MEGQRRRFYGAVTVSERGQVVIPAQARRDLEIEIGEKLLVLGGPGGGLLLVKASVIGRMLGQWMDLFHWLEEEGLTIATEGMNERE